MATLNLGRIKPVFRGAYSGSTAYVVDDIVTSGGSSYICIQAHGAGTQAVNQTAYWTQMAASGTDVGTTITTQGDLLYRDGSGLQRLAAGTAGYVLQTGGTGANPSWTAVSSDFVKLQSGGSSSAVSEIIFDNLDVSTYSAFKFIWNGVPSADGNHFRLQIRTGGASGASYTTSNYYSAQLMVTGGSGSIATRVDLSQDYWEVAANAGNGSHEGHRAVIWFYPRKSTHEDWHGNTFHAIADRVDESNNFRHITSSGRIMLSSGTQPTMTGFKVYNTGGNIKQYDYELYGIK